ncbi:putative glutathione s-transferase [Podospora conica]|nr:putative glutathione s-transferase [Schizothecium conicum]
MASNQQITLFDIPCREPRKTWSLNPWKIRMLLNYKGLDYKTEWLEYPDIHARLSPHLAPNPPGALADYTIPTIHIPHPTDPSQPGEYIMESLAIARRLEALHPSPPLPIDSKALAYFTANYGDLMTRLRGFWAVEIPRRLLNPPSAAYWRPHREALFGQTLEAMEAEHGGPEEPFRRAEGRFREVTALLKEDEGGPFFEGATVGYADFVWAGFLLFVRAIGEEGYRRVLEGSGDPGVHERLLEAVGAWTERDSW